MLHAAPPIPRLGVPAYNWWNECLHGVGRAGRATVFPQSIGLAATFNLTLLGRIATAISELLSTIDVGLNTGDIDPRLLAQYKLLTSVTWETPSEVHSTKFMATFTLPTVFGPHFRVAVFQEPPPSLASR